MGPITGKSREYPAKIIATLKHGANHGGMSDNQAYEMGVNWPAIHFSPNSVSTLRGSYGGSEGRCLIRVLTLVSRLFPENFGIKWLLWNLDMRFDCAGLHKVCVRVLGSIWAAWEFPYKVALVKCRSAFRQPRLPQSVVLASGLRPFCL